MIHHAPVQLGGGPKLQLLSQPEPEVVKAFLTPQNNFLESIKLTTLLQINVKESDFVSLECEVAGVKPIGSIRTSQMQTLSITHCNCQSRCVLVPRRGATEARQRPIEGREWRIQNCAIASTNSRQASTSPSSGYPWPWF